MFFRKGGATLHLHIGRNKAGSTTLQAYFLKHVAEMREAGVQYALFNQPNPAGITLPNFTTHYELADFIRAQPGGAVLVSHEGLCCFTPEMTQVMASDLAKLDLQVIFYVRPYTEWIVSSYCFDVRMGLNGRDFDRYLEWMRPIVSCWPTLEIWGQMAGWDRLHVRSLHPSDLQGCDLLTDCLTAIGLPPVLGASRANVSPSWIVIELLRRIVGCDAADGWNRTQLAVAEAMHELADLAINACGVPDGPVGYLTCSQAAALATQYNQDLNDLASMTGIVLQKDNQDRITERKHLPSAARIPRSVLQDIKLRALKLDYARLHPEIANFVVSSSFCKLCSLAI